MPPKTDHGEITVKITACQKTDFASHMLLCNEFKAFISKFPRPSSECVLAFHFAADEELPELAWVTPSPSMVNGSTTWREEAGKELQSRMFVIEKNMRQNQYIDYKLCVVSTIAAQVPNKSLNKALAPYGVPDYRALGPVVVCSHVETSQDDNSKQDEGEDEDEEKKVLRNIVTSGLMTFATFWTGSHTRTETTASRS
ncbi:Uu.00g009690.m01.CDS01 [Anthostomella pinea]|uniref:Uu.00g009690.m01.CDS01 n=1 Tax=Anthostomella pinea TaxID=933095 RepID=A0AAI8VY24_9PEZI|nr:Uu.00g009690.m01.CDS01 [Anthostomella pinea]